MPIPDANSLIQNYPQGSAEEVKRQIGGAVNAEWITNTCAIRLSHSFNRSGAKIPGNVSYLNTVRGGNKDRYAFRVREFRKWLESKYGRPTLKVRGTGSTTAPADFRGRKGIICFVDCGWSDASGHLDLWDGDRCVNHGYFELAKEILLWESRPQQAPNPPSGGGGGGSGAPGQRTGTVTASNLNVRAAPEPRAAIVGSLARGTVVPILSSRNGFYQVAAGGWASSSYIRV